MRIRSPVSGVSVFWSVLFVVYALGSATKAQQLVPNTPSPQTPKTQTTGSLENSWPRTFANGIDTFTIYLPQVDKWDENLISLYCAVEVRAGKESAAKYGVVWFQARTEVDKVNRLVTLDRLEAALDEDSEAVKGVDVKNDPPKVIIASKPSLLVLIDGMPQMGDVPGLKLRTVINTRSIILYDDGKQLY